MTTTMLGDAEVMHSLSPARAATGVRVPLLQRQSAVESLVDADGTSTSREKSFAGTTKFVPHQNAFKMEAASLESKLPYTTLQHSALSTHSHTHTPGGARRPARPFRSGSLELDPRKASEIPDPRKRTTL